MTGCHICYGGMDATASVQESIDVACGSGLVVAQRHGSTADDEHAGPLAGTSQCLRQILKEFQELIATERSGAGHARSRSLAAMKTPCSRKMGGVSARIMASIAGRAATYQPELTLSGRMVHAGWGQPSRSAKWRARAAKAASTCMEPVGGAPR